MNPKYKGWTEHQRWQEYGRLKREFYKQHGWVKDAKVYDDFIQRIVDELGI